MVFQRKRLTRKNKGGNPLKVVVHSPKIKSKSKHKTRERAVAPRYENLEDKYYYDPEMNKYLGEIDVVVHNPTTLDKGYKYYVGGFEQGQLGGTKKRNRRSRKVKSIRKHKKSRRSKSRRTRINNKKRHISKK